MNDCCKKKIRNEENKKILKTRINKIKGQIPIMYRNYEKRVKEFVIDMTNPESIIEHKDFVNFISSGSILNANTNG